MKTLRQHPAQQFARLAAIAIACLGLGTWALAADTGTAPAPTPATATRHARPRLEIGMTADQIREIAGRPHRVKPLKQQGVIAEIWFYTYSKQTRVRQVPTGTRDTPVADPLSGTMKLLKEPTYSLERTFWEETTELLMVEGALVSAKRYRSAGRDYN